MATGLPAIHSATKLATLNSDWVEDGEGRLHLTLSLEVGGATIEGLFLRARARRAMAEREVMFQIEHRPAYQPQEQLGRIDWRPFHTHRNKGKGPEEFRFKDIVGSHHHSFELNWLEQEQRMRRDNLPIAVPISDDPAGFRQLIALVSKEFRITNLGELQVPPWDLML